MLDFAQNRKQSSILRIKADTNDSYALVIAGSYLLAVTNPQADGEFAIIDLPLDGVAEQQRACVRFMHYSSDSSARLYFIMTSSDGASTTMNVTRPSDGGKDAAKTSEIQQLVYEYSVERRAIAGA